MGEIRMLITPKRGYRVCLHCGKILLSKQVVDGKFNGKKVKVCPFCNEPEKISTGNDIINDYQAMDLFKIVGFKSKEFFLTPELEAKYEEMYDNCLIPKEVRI